MGKSGWGTADGEQRMGNSGWGTADGEQRMGNSGWGTADGEQRMALIPATALDSGAPQPGARLSRRWCKFAPCCRSSRFTEPARANTLEQLTPGCPSYLLFCIRYSASAVLHLLFCIRCSASAVLYPLFCICCSVSAVLYPLFCIRYSASAVVFQASGILTRAEAFLSRPDRDT